MLVAIALVITIVVLYLLIIMKKKSSRSEGNSTTYIGQGDSDWSGDLSYFPKTK